MSKSKEIKEKEYSIDEIRYHSLLKTFKNYPIGWGMAVKTVGGEKRLRDLMEKGLVTYIEEPGINDAPQRKQKINFAQCMMYSKPLNTEKLNNVKFS